MLRKHSLGLNLPRALVRLVGAHASERGEHDAVAKSDVAAFERLKESGRERHCSDRVACTAAGWLGLATQLRTGILLVDF